MRSQCATSEGAAPFGLAVVRGRDRNVGRRRGVHRCGCACIEADVVGVLIFGLRLGLQPRLEALRRFVGAICDEVLLRFKLVERGARGGGKGHKMLVLH